MKFSPLRIYLSIVICSFVVVCCARIGSPTGGKKDIIPPKLVKTTPKILETKVSTDLTKIELLFNEYVLLNKTEEIIFAPYLKNPPIFKSVGIPTKKIVIDLKNKLKEDTTYQINFGNSITDNNEGNKLPYLNFVFTTGSKIDSLEISGKLTETFVGKAKEKKNYLAGLFEINKQYKDSTIIKERPLYVAKVDSTNFFKLANLKKEEYKLIVFNDLNNNSIYEQETEDFGYLSENLKLNKNLDSVKINISEPEKKYKLKDLKYVGYGRLNFNFNGLSKKIKIEAINKKHKNELLNGYADSLSYWFNPDLNELGKQIKFKVTNTELNKIDSISCFVKKNKNPELKISFSNNLNTIDQNLLLKSNSPLTEIKNEKIKIFKINKKDSIVVPFNIVDDEKEILNKKIFLKTENNAKYALKIEKNALKDLFGNANKTNILEEIELDQKKLAKISLTFINELNLPFNLIIYNDANNLVYEKYINTSKLEIDKLLPGKYSVLVQVDENKDGVINKSNFFINIQPEKTSYLKDVIEARAMWLVKEDIQIPN